MIVKVKKKISINPLINEPHISFLIIQTMLSGKKNGSGYGRKVQRLV